MKRALSFNLLFIVTFFAAIHSYSQEGFSVHGGACIPVFQYSNNDINELEAGGAAFGFMLGARYAAPLNNHTFNFFINADFNLNGLDKKFKDDVESMIGPGYEVTFFKYYNIPVMVGMQAHLPVNEKTRFFAEAGFGVDFLKITDLTVSGIDIVYTAHPQAAFQVGAGLLFNEKISLGIYFVENGRHKVDNDLVISGGQGQALAKYKQKIEFINVSMGIKF